MRRVISLLIEFLVNNWVVKYDNICDNPSAVFIALGPYVKSS
jgi:hypothetical protein